jgi:hypothetical protein
MFLVLKKLVEIAVDKFKKYALPGNGVIPLEVVYSG